MSEERWALLPDFGGRYEGSTSGRVRTVSLDRRVGNGLKRGAVRYLALNRGLYRLVKGCGVKYVAPETIKASAEEVLKCK